MENFFKKYWWALLLIIILLLLFIAWLLFMGKNEDEDNNTPTPTTTATSQATKSATPSSKKAEETESDADLLKKAVSKKTGIDIDLIVVEISKNTGKYAKGLVSAKGEMGGGYWIAVKEDGKWSVVFDGQSTPECSLVDPPGFPADMVPECIDLSGNLKVRK